MIKPGSKLSAGLLPLLAVVLALALPGAASAQDPSVDQYTPTAPDGGGSVPTSPVPNTDGGNGPGPTGDGGSDGGSSGSSGDESDTGSTAPVAPAATTPADPAGTSTTTGGNGNGKEKQQSTDERTLAGIAAAAAAQREDANAARSDGPATELLRSDTGGGLGMGVLLWAVLGVTALWAVATAVRRRQDGDGHPA